MLQTSFQHLINPDSSQVFICSCPAHIPFSFGIHSWFVCNAMGDLHKWDCLFRKNLVEKQWGHIHKDTLPLFSGIEMFPFSQKRHWNTQLLGYIEGTTAQKLITYIEKTPIDYPHKDCYALLGPNSNTYVQSILDHFPDLNIRLPWNAVGKGYGG